MATLFGLEIEDLPEDMTALEMVLVVKTMRPAGSEKFPYALVARCTDGLSIWEAAGMTRWWAVATDVQLKDMLGGSDGED